MAIGDDYKPRIRYPDLTRPGFHGPASIFSDWVSVNTATTAQTAGDELSPDAIDDATFHWLDVDGHNVTRVRARLQADDGISAIATDAVIVLVGEFGDGSYGRLDSPTDADAAGITLALGTSAGGTLMEDGTWIYSDPTTTYDTLGARKIGAIVTTAGSYTNGGTVSVQLQVLN
jgi:hypothetical protein